MRRKIIISLMLTIFILGCQYKNSNDSMLIFENADLELLYVYNNPKKFTKPYNDPLDNSIIYVDTLNVICNQSNLRNLTIERNYDSQPMIVAKLDEEGAEKFSKATEESLGRKIAIISKGKLLSAPIVNEQINGGTFIISGNYTLEELMKLKEEIINNNQADK